MERRSWQKKKHHWATGPNQAVWDDKTHRLAKNMIGNCPHLTPATEMIIDNLLHEKTVGDRNEPTIEAESVSLPNLDVIAAMTEHDDWVDTEPTSDELAAIEQQER